MVGLVAVVFHVNVPRVRAFLTLKDLVDVYTGRDFHITIADFGETDVHLPKHEKVGEVADVSVEVDHVNDERFSYRFGTHTNNSDDSVYDIPYKPAFDRLEQIANLEVVNEKKEESLDKDCRGDVQLPDKFKFRRTAFLKMLGKFEGMLKGHVGQINESKHLIDVLNKADRPAQYVPYWAVLLAKQFSAAEKSRMLSETFIEPATT